MTMETDERTVFANGETPETILNRITDFGSGQFWLLSQVEADEARKGWGSQL